MISIELDNFFQVLPPELHSTDSFCFWPGLNETIGKLYKIMVLFTHIFVLILRILIFNHQASNTASNKKKKEKKKRVKEEKKRDKEEDGLKIVEAEPLTYSALQTGMSVLARVSQV